MSAYIETTNLARDYVQQTDLVFPWDYTDQAETVLSGGAADICDVYLPGAGLLIGWGYQVTTTINGSTTPPVISIDVCDYDGTSNRVEHDAITIAHATAAANAVVWHLFTPPIAVAEGRGVVLEHKTAADTAGGARVWCVIRLS